MRAGLRLGFAAIAGLALTPAGAGAQDAAFGGRQFIYRAGAPADPQSIVFSGSSFEILDAAAFESGKAVKDSPFSADAVTEFTQTLGDGNRIERTFKASIARDGRGRTRREEEIALLGPLAGQGEPPRLVTVTDPENGLHYTFDNRLKIAHTNRLSTNTFVVEQGNGSGRGVGAGAGTASARVEVRGTTNFAVGPLAASALPGSTFELAAGDRKAVTETLGTQQIEGLTVEGTRTTTTIPAGAIGNQLPIDVVTERWFSPELQVPVLITRRDPRSGDTSYRLTNIVRAEPPEDLFTVPAGFHSNPMHDPAIELDKVREKLKKAAPSK